MTLRVAGAVALLAGILIWVWAARADALFNSADLMGMFATLAGITALMWPQNEDDEDEDDVNE